MNECLICYNNVDEKSKLNLICECKYIVHNECYEKWYIKNPSCIICHKFSFPPTKSGRKEKEKYNKKNSVIAILVYVIIIIYILFFNK